MSTYVPPKAGESKFHCPHCNVLARQVWLAHGIGGAGHIKFCRCDGCEDISVWNSRILIHPVTSMAPQPHEDMPENVKAEYDEARSIVSRSPRGAAALLRLGIQKLLKHLGEEGDNINDDIGSLVKKGLPVRIQQAYDAIRIIGNESVHPGQINLNDTPEIADALFGLVNIIVEVMIAQPKNIEALYNSLPPEKLKQIDNRDA